MGLGCARCGDCCETIWLPVRVSETLAEWAAKTPEQQAELGPAPNHDFLLAHWHEQERSEGSVRYACDAFDPVHRICTAHADRPPICRDFPWYGGEPGDLAGTAISNRCSYWLDVPRVQRPDDARPLLPLVAV